MAIATLVKSIQDIMRKDVGVDGDAQRIGQLVWLLFLKILDDKEQEWELTLDDYQSPLEEEFRWCNWAKDDEGMTGDELIEFVNNDLFPALKALETAGGSSLGRAIGSVFADAYNYMKSGTWIKLNNISIKIHYGYTASANHDLKDIRYNIKSV
ncbi:MAG: type I restriction-modification system subunit M N-terminal domain-containing protein [Limnospira sp.]